MLAASGKYLVANARDIYVGYLKRACHFNVSKYLGRYRGKSKRIASIVVRKPIQILGNVA